MFSFVLFMGLQNRGSLQPIFEHVTKDMVPRPYTRVSPDDNNQPFGCTFDIHCPKGSKCYAPKPLGSHGICVVSYDMKIFEKKDHEYWFFDC